MRIWTTFILINIIYLTHVSTAPVNNSGKGSGLTSKFGNIADAIINPKWTLNVKNQIQKKRTRIRIQILTNKMMMKTIQIHQMMIQTIQV
ncbi:uncharacterized protein LOC113554710 isoform X2 [Rhopalosiphum maidis]|uniref:uncharacterized protein LOC113554710 isoform X2 n=1 Tax=Rhopalosiphum maidis TaxID=43146 RepID=UPI000EFDDE02|nr:uncharacterized protein LOC113554710 isoform X2 [Rhopalosiphum maidis]